MVCSDIEIRILLISNVSIVSLIFAIIVEIVFLARIAFANFPLLMISFYVFFLIEHIILFIGCLKVRHFKIFLKKCLIFFFLEKTNFRCGFHLYEIIFNSGLHNLYGNLQYNSRGQFHSSQFLRNYPVLCSSFRSFSIFTCYM